MATAQLAPPADVQRFRLDDITWQAYVTIADALGERPVRLTYDRGRLEFMTTSPRHESWKSTFALLIPILCEELEIDFACFGSMTIRREELDRGFEPDECYYIAHFPDVHGRSDLDLDTDPPPDLAVEIEVSRTAWSRLGTYAAMRVPEVWCYDGAAVRVLILNAEGAYASSPQSPSFPALPVAEFAQFIPRREELGDRQLMRVFRAWVRATLLPPAAGGPPNPPT